MRANISNNKSQRWRVLAFLGVALLCAVSAEVACRTFWYFQYEVPLLSPDRVLYAYSPKLATLDEIRPAHNDAYFDVLLLGGSVLNPQWGYIEPNLKQRLLDMGYKNVRLYNLSEPAHTSRDSLLKYRALESSRFDLVIFYHGINDARANNVQPHLYKDNYDHYFWYEIINGLSDAHLNASLALPYTIQYIWHRARQTLRSDEYVEIHIARQDWMHFGSSLRSVNSFKQNIDALLDIAKRRGDRVALMTFAMYVPDNYSLALFQAKSLDYGLHLTPIEVWGDRYNVESAVSAQNEAVRELAATRKGVYFIDMARIIPQAGMYFDDACHLTREGAYIFADELSGFISQLISTKGVTNK